MLYYLGEILQNAFDFGPARLLQSYTVLIVIALYTGFLVTEKLLPHMYRFLPSDRGREFTLTAEAAKGKPTGSGCIFITIFVVECFLVVPMTIQQVGIVVLTWLTMLTGFLDDNSITSWGEYKKGLLDLLISLAAAFLLYCTFAATNTEGTVSFWLPFITHLIRIPMPVYVVFATILLWASINTTNCTDGVDGLSSTLVLIALITLGSLFYFVLGHTKIAAYLLVPHLIDGASWAVITFALAGVLMGYLWHNAFPSHVLMGDAGSRALGFFIGTAVLITGNPFIILATSSIIFINGGMGLMKVFLLRFFKIHIFENVRFPLHDHMRKNHGWSPTQVLIKFMIMQLLITVALIGIIFKVR
ncbi:MAG: phospho-N-acetylmuramoyl-pentapeptide-transferase [Treponema sp.]|nr:phospho-N-acetylmuramoyl-pentapeptide-transferase [Treponema sp.]